MLVGRRFFDHESGAAYILLLELHFGLWHVKGSEKSCSKETNPVFTQAAFLLNSTATNILRECYSEKHYLRKQGLPKGGKDDTVRSQTPATSLGPSALPTGASSPSRLWLRAVP